MKLSVKYASGGALKTVRQLITSTVTWTKPVRFVEGSLVVTGTGGGASGCSSGATSIAGANAGEWVYRMPLDVSAVSSLLVTIGAGGVAVNGGGVNTAGNAGGATTLGALLSLAGAAATLATAGRATTVGGARGGLSTTNVAHENAAQSNMSAIGGNAGCNTSVITGSSPCGAGGIVVDGSGKKAGDYNAFGGGIGYGAGGASSNLNSAPSGAGANGVVLLEWEEQQ